MRCYWVQVSYFLRLSLLFSCSAEQNSSFFLILVCHIVQTPTEPNSTWMRTSCHNNPLVYCTEIFYKSWLVWLLCERNKYWKCTGIRKFRIPISTIRKCLHSRNSGYMEDLMGFFFASMGWRENFDIRRKLLIVSEREVVFRREWGGNSVFMTCQDFGVVLLLVYFHIVCFRTYKSALFNIYAD